MAVAVEFQTVSYWQVRVDALYRSDKALRLYAATKTDPLMTLNNLDLPGRPEDTRIVVAMSGGVDSSVVAGILKRQGYDVVGVTLQLYDHGASTHRAGSCCAGQDIEDARRVSERL